MTGREADARRRPRTTLPLTLEYDPALPISAHRQEILAALGRHSVLIVCGATGCGKSTQLPKLCLEAGRGTAGLIGHTQPRRIAARALATRLAEELRTTVGGAVGYQVRFTDRTGPDCRVKLMTDGILLKELESDPSLRRYDTVILDEAHERTLNIDVLLGVMRRLLPRRPELRLIVTSATLEPQRLSAFFDGAPVIEVSGRSFPVEVRYRPLGADDEDSAELSLPEGILRAVRELDALGARGRGDTLVFLPGEKHIREAAEELAGARLPGTTVLPLYARLSATEQSRIFEAHTERRIILATNVAETSLTVPGIRHVIDSGLARIGRYSARGKVQRLHVEPISRASAEQRKGRSGREAPGICIRLFSEAQFAAREAFTPPEILRANLASVILRLATLELGEPEDFPFLDPPDRRLVGDGVRLLEELQAMSERKVTRLGRQLAGLPVDPRLGRMLLAAARERCLAEMLIIAAFLETQDPRERPQEMQQQADERHAAFADSRSDFLSLLNLWRAFAEQSAALSGGALRRWCREHFLSFLRMREWQELHAQLARSARELGLGLNHSPAGYAALHQAILTGFLGSVGALDERREYDGPRGLRFVIAPGTPLASKPPQWVVAASLLETTRVYARVVASVKPAWIERAAAHLLKRSYSEPHWAESRGWVAAYESVSLFGLTLAARRRVNYGPVAPREARDIFIRAALVEPRHAPDSRRATWAFLEANRRLRRELEGLEAKIRRRDILAGEEREVELYAARIPERASSIAEFERWRAEAERTDPRALRFSRADLALREAPEITEERFPDTLAIAGTRLPLIYRFEPGEPADGLTLIVPDVLLDSLDSDRLAWLVPGWRLEKITAVLRELPKARRKLLVPVPEHARQALEALTAGAGAAAPCLELPGFHEALAAWVSDRIGAPVCAHELAALELPPHWRMNFRVVDAGDRVLAEGRELPALRRAVAAAAAAARAEPSVALHRLWDFGDLPQRRQIERNGLSVTVHPALEDRGAGVALIDARTHAHAEEITRFGVARLARLALAQQERHLERRIGETRELVLLSRAVALAQPLPQALTQRIFLESAAAEGEPLPRSRASFQDRLDQVRGRLHSTGERLMALMAEIFTEWRTARAALESARRAGCGEAAADVEAQLAALMGPDFIRSTPRTWMQHLPRYLKAITRRLARAQGEERRDRALAARVRPFVAALRGLEAQAAGMSSPVELEKLRWMIEEFRVSLFAQDLGTALTVSEQRLAEQLERARRL